MTEVHVTGGTGFVGSHLCNRLVEDGHDVVALSRSPGESPIEVGDEVERGEADVTEPESLEFSDADVVVHLVALSPLLQPKGKTHHEVTAEGTRNVVEACERDDVAQLVHLSALGADVDGSTRYLRAKGAAEETVRSSDVGSAVFRPSVVFGEGGEFEGFVRRLTTPYVTGLPGGGRNRFQPLWVGDLVEMIEEAVDEVRTGVWDIGGPDVLSLADVARLVYLADGRSLRIVSVPMPLARVGLTAVDPLPCIPMGVDQYRSLEIDNVVEGENDVAEFGLSEASMLGFGDYLGVEAS